MTTVLTEVITDFHAIVTPVLIPVMAVVTVVFALFQALLILLPMSKTIKATLSNIFTVLCCVVIIVGIVSLIAAVAGIRPFVMISESMHPEVPKGSLVLLNTNSKMNDAAVGDNVAYVLGKVEAMHKTVSVGSGELVVKSLADNGESTVTPSTYLGKEVLSIPAVGGWIRKMLDYKWIVIVAGVGLVVIGCMPGVGRKPDKNP